MPEKKPAPYAPQKPSYHLEENSDTGVYPYLHILRNRKKIVIASTLFLLSIAFVSNLVQRPVYEASTELLIQPTDSKTSPNASANNFRLDPTLLLTQFRMVRSPHLAEKTFKKLEKNENREILLEAYGVRASRKKKDTAVFSEKERQLLMGAIRRSLSAYQVERETRLIGVAAESYDPRAAALVANAASEAYVELNYESNMESFRQSFQLISDSLGEIREKIKVGEIAFEKITSEVKLLEALKIYEQRHPLVIQLRTDIPRLTQQLKRETQNLERLKIGQRQDLVPLLMTAHVNSPELQKIEKDLYILRPILEQELITNREMYNSVFKRMQEIQLTGLNWGIEVKLVEPAGVPGLPVRPNKRLNLIIGFFVGIFLGIGLAFFLEYLDSSIRGIEDIRTHLKLFPLGMIPCVEIAARETAADDPEAQKASPADPLKGSARTFWLASDRNIPLYVAEAYRIVRTNLAFGSIDQSLKALQVTSTVKGEGKTTTVANLGISLALAGSRILLVDADMRRPALHRVLGMEEVREGLAEALTHGKPWASLIVSTSTPNLFFMSSGTIPPNPAELLSSKRMKTLIEELKEHYDMVIFDSPPVISVADAAVLGSRLDGTIFILRSGLVPRHLCQQAKRALESVNAKIVGCILNSVQSAHQSYYDHHYYQEYGRYDTREDGSKAKIKISGSDLGSWVEKLKMLKEPLGFFITSAGTRLGGMFKGAPNEKKEPKSSVDAS